MQGATPALFRRFPELRRHLPWLSLGMYPTSLQRLELSGVKRELWLKRDDLSATPYGGNKVRKLEFILAAAKERGAKRLITVGAAGSHHALATTIYGRRLGFEVTLVLFPQPLTTHVRDMLLLDRAFGAELRFTRRMETVPAALFVTALRYRREHPLIIPAGGSDAVGTLGYVSAALELAEQLETSALPAPATIVVAAGTLGTAAGLALGLAIAGLKSHLKAVRITGRIVCNERALVRLVRSAESLLRRFGADINVADDAVRRVQLVHDFIGPGYGHGTAAGRAATERLQQVGIHLDDTYTAKAAAALLSESTSASAPVLFWHTLSASEPTAALGRVSAEALPAPFRKYLASRS